MWPSCRGRSVWGVMWSFVGTSTWSSLHPRSIFTDTDRGLHKQEKRILWKGICQKVNNWWWMNRYEFIGIRRADLGWVPKYNVVQKPTKTQKKRWTLLRIFFYFLFLLHEYSKKKKKLCWNTEKTHKNKRCIPGDFFYFRKHLAEGSISFSFFCHRSEPAAEHFTPPLLSFTFLYYICFKPCVCASLVQLWLLSYWHCTIQHNIYTCIYWCNSLSD